MIRLARAGKAGSAAIAAGVLCLGAAVAAGAVSAIHTGSAPGKSFSYSILSDSNPPPDSPPFDAIRADIITVNDVTIQVACPNRGDAYLVLAPGKGSGRIEGEDWEEGVQHEIHDRVGGDLGLSYLYVHTSEDGPAVSTAHGEFLWHSDKTNNNTTVHFTLEALWSDPVRPDHARCSLYGTTG